MIIVAGHLRVDASQRAAYLDSCTSVVRLARETEGCLDFTITGDLLDPQRVNVFERWSARTALDTFRGSGPGDEQSAVILSATVAEYDVSQERSLA